MRKPSGLISCNQPGPEGGRRRQTRLDNPQPGAGTLTQRPRGLDTPSKPILQNVANGVANGPSSKRHYRLSAGADDGIRTHTPRRKGILSPLRLPFRHVRESGQLYDVRESGQLYDVRESGQL